MNLSQKQLQELENIILELPTKYGVQLLQFFNQVKQDNAVVTESEKSDKED